MGEVETDAVGEQGQILQPTFNGAIRIESRPERLTADAGALLVREVMERVGIIDWLIGRLRDMRTPSLITHPLSELLRTALTLLTHGWANGDHADLLRDDPALRLAVSDRKQDAPLRPPPAGTLVPDGLPSQPTISRLYQALSSTENQSTLAEANLILAQQRRGWLGPQRRLDEMSMDIDSFPVRVHGHQEGSAYNAYYHSRCYHPLVFGSADTQEFFGAILREGQVHTADGLEEQLPVFLDWAHTHLADHITIRADAGFPSDALLTQLEAYEPSPSYVFRIKSYTPLKEATKEIVAAYQEEFTKDPAALREEEFRCCELRYRGKEWSRQRRVVLVMLPPESGHLFVRFFFLITSFPRSMTGALLMDLYRQRGTYEQMIGQFKSTLAPQLSSTGRSKQHYRGRVPTQRYPSRDAFATNQVILSLNLLAYNLLSLIAHLHERAHRRPGRPKVYGRSSPRITPKTVRQWYLKIAARVTLHGRRVWVSISERAAPYWQQLWTLLDKLGHAPSIG